MVVVGLSRGEAVWVDEGVAEVADSFGALDAELLLSDDVLDSKGHDHLDGDGPLKGVANHASLQREWVGSGVAVAFSVEDEARLDEHWVDELGV